MNSSARTICLAIVLRPGTKITRKCLESVAPFIDSWVILACQRPRRAGRGNQLPESSERVTEILDHLPGQTVHHDFTDFATAWSHAFSLAREMANTVLMLEADERIQCFDSGISLAPGTEIGLLEIQTPRFSLRQPRLLRSDVTVEFLDSATGQAGQILFDGRHVCETAPHVNILPRLHDDGIRLKEIPNLNDDIARLHSRLGSDSVQAASPAGLNILLSTAHSCLQAGKTKKAIKYFQAVADQVTEEDLTDGNRIELYWQARYFLALIHTSKNRIPDALDLLSACITQDLERLEPFMRLAEIFEANNELERAATLIELTIDVSQPLLARYSEPSIYHYSARMMAAKLNARLGRTDAAIDHADKLGLHQDLPKEIEKQRKELLAEQHQAERTRNASDPPIPLTPLAAQPGPATSPSPSPILTIGMATYDDFDGVYFTVMSIMLYHRAALPDIEIVVIDNNPDSSHGQSVAKFCRHTGQVRYIPAAEYKGTTIRERVFAEARGKFVLCVDCHVFLHEGAVSRLLEYCAKHSDSADLLHGPLCYDNFQHISTHMEKRWNEGFFGVWGTDPRAKNGDGEPFEIPLQGMGLFACRKAAWPGFNRKFRGFGGEEGYIHEKVRQNGGRTLCLPFLQWSHRFERPNGVQYINSWEDRIRNYLIGWDELGMPTTELLQHFSNHINHEAASSANAWFIQEKRSPLWAFDTIFWLSGSDSAWARELKTLKSLSIDRITQKIELADTPNTGSQALIQAQWRILDLAIRQNLDDIVIINGSHEFIKNPRKKLLSAQSKLEDKKADVLATNEFCADFSGPDSDSSPSTAADPAHLAMDHLLIIRNNAFQSAQAIINAGQTLTLSNLEAHQPNLSIQRLS